MAKAKHADLAGVPHPPVGASSPRLEGLAVLGFCALLIALAYGNSLRNELVYDDRTLIAGNDMITRLENLPTFFVSDWWAGTEQSVGVHAGSPAGDKRYRPLVVATYALNYALGGPDPVGYRLVNLVFHTGVSWLLYLLARVLGVSLGGAVVAAGIFAVHPLHSEAVDWIVGRPELMMSFFVLASLWLSIRGHRSASLAAFLLGLFSKEQAVMLPFMLVLYDVCERPSPLRGRASGGLGRTLFLRYGGYAALMTGYAVVRVSALGWIQPAPYPRLEDPLEYVSGGGWLLNVLMLAGRYLWLCVWPSALSADYSYDAIPPAAFPFDPRVLWAFVAWGGLLGVAARWWRRDGRATLCIGLTMISFLPASNLVIPVGTPFAERLFYLPSAGLCLLAGLACQPLFRWIGNDVGAGGRAPAPAPVAAGGLPTRWLGFGGICLLVGLGAALLVRTAIRNRDWVNDETLFRSMVRVVPNDAKAHALLAHTLKRKGGKGAEEEALASYRTASRLYPEYFRSDPVFASNLGQLLMQMGMTQEAVEALEQAAALNPRWSTLKFNLGLAYAKQGRYGKAEETWREALALNPKDPQIHSSLSRVLVERGGFEEALREADRALELDPQFLFAHMNRAMALEGLSRFGEAASEYERLLALKPGLQDVQQRLQNVRAREEKAGRASSGPVRPGGCPPGLMVC